MSVVLNSPFAGLSFTNALTRLTVDMETRTLKQLERMAEKKSRETGIGWTPAQYLRWIIERHCLNQDPVDRLVELIAKGKVDVKRGF